MRPAPMLAAVVAVLLGACAAPGTTAQPSASAGGGASSTGPASPRSAPSATLPPAPSPTPLRTSPLTGRPEVQARPVLVVKLDNTGNAQPHAGLDRADVVYLEEVEYGITRIAAVFASEVPERIGPVRSARITDLDLLAQYGAPAFAFSGAQRKLWPAIADSSLADVSPNKGAEGYARDRSRRAPYNYFVDGRIALDRAPDATVTHDVGFLFSDSPPPGGQPARGASMAWGGADASFSYDSERGDYRVSLNGRRAKAEGNDAGQRASTVVIQHVRQQPSAYFDRGGGNTPHADTIGSGTATVLRDGLAFDARWVRESAGSGTLFTLSDGTPMTFKPGQQWIVLLNRSTPETLTLPRPEGASTGSASPSPSR